MGGGNSGWGSASLSSSMSAVMMFRFPNLVRRGAEVIPQECVTEGTGQLVGTKVPHLISPTIA